MRTTYELISDAKTALEQSLIKVNKIWRDTLIEACDGELNEDEYCDLALENILEGHIDPESWVTVSDNYDDDIYWDSGFSSDGNEIVENFFDGSNWQGDFTAGVEKIVFIPWYEDKVVKFIIQDNGLYSESDIYDDAKIFGVQDFFATIYETGTVTINGSVYGYTIMEKCDTDEDALAYYRYMDTCPKNELLDPVVKRYKRTVLSDCGYGFMLYKDYFEKCVSTEKINMLKDFLTDLRINDLHSGNIAWSTDNKVKIIDYSDIHF